MKSQQILMTKLMIMMKSSRVVKHFEEAEETGFDSFLPNNCGPHSL